MSYQGFSTWETWNTSLWLNNNEIAYKDARRICRTQLLSKAEKSLEDLAKEIIPKNENISFCMVNWEEIYNDFNEE